MLKNLRNDRTGEDMPDLPSWATSASAIRLALATQLAAACPPHLAAEIAVTGSTSRGIADDLSDIEINHWLPVLPAEGEIIEWLRSVGAVEVTPTGINHIDRSRWFTFLYKGIWVEAGWAEIGHWNDMLRPILAGDVTGHTLLTMASTAQHAVILRTDGVLPRWQEELAGYPDGLAAKIIATNTGAWSDPHVPSVRWALARRRQTFGLAMRLQWDIDNLLCNLWALNRRWDEDFKWVDERILDLPLAPPRLVERIHRVFRLDDPERCITICFELIAETLQLLAPQFDVEAALRNIRAGLETAPAAPRRDRACAAIIRDGHIVMVFERDQYAGRWMLPGGGVQPGETPEQTVLREALEEACVHGENPVLLYERFYGPSKNSIESCFLVQIPPDAEPSLGSDPELAAHEQEIKAVAWRPLDELRDDLQVGRVLEALDLMRHRA